VCVLCVVGARFARVPQEFLEGIRLGQYWERFAALGAENIDDVLDPEAFSDADVSIKALEKRRYNCTRNA